MGRQPQIWNDGFRGFCVTATWDLLTKRGLKGLKGLRGLKGWVALAGLMAAGTLFAFQPIPRDSARALGVTRGKAFDGGLVFINGKFLPPPYTVERWGTGLRINGRSVSGQVIDWSEFLKTQSGVKVTRTESAAQTPAASAATLPTETEKDELSSSLDDLFDDNPKPKKAKKTASRTSANERKAPARPKVSVSYSLDSDFVPNDASKALVARINASRSEIDRQLRLGGFIFFGDGYARVTGDARTAGEFMEKAPELLQHSENARALAAAVRSAGMAYLTDQICEDLFRNRIDYRILQERRAKVRKDNELRKLLGQ